MKTSFTKQDINRYSCSGHLPRCIMNRVRELHILSFKRLQRMKDGNQWKYKIKQNLARMSNKGVIK